jgi:hypothetical protein
VAPPKSLESVGEIARSKSSKASRIIRLAASTFRSLLGRGIVARRAIEREQCLRSRNTENRRAGQKKYDVVRSICAPRLPNIHRPVAQVTMHWSAAQRRGDPTKTNVSAGGNVAAVQPSRGAMHVAENAEANHEAHRWRKKNDFPTSALGSSVRTALH